VNRLSLKSWWTRWHAPTSPHCRNQEKSSTRQVDGGFARLRWSSPACYRWYLWPSWRAQDRWSHSMAVTALPAGQERTCLRGRRTQRHRRAWRPGAFAVLALLLTIPPNPVRVESEPTKRTHAAAKDRDLPRTPLAGPCSRFRLTLEKVGAPGGRGVSGGTPAIATAFCDARCEAFGSCASSSRLTPTTGRNVLSSSTRMFWIVGGAEWRVHGPGRQRFAKARGLAPLTGPDTGFAHSRGSIEQDCDSHQHNDVTAI